MANFKLNSVLVATESGGTVSLNSATVVPAAGITGVLPVGVTGGSGLTALGTVTAGNIDGISDIKKVASGAYSDVGSIDVQGCFSDTNYKFFKFVSSGGGALAVAGYMELGFLDSSNNFLNQTYYTRGVQWYSPSSTGANTDAWTSTTHNISYVTMNTIEGLRIDNTWSYDRVEEQGTMEVLICEPLRTDKQVHVSWLSSSAAENYITYMRGIGFQNNNTAKHGLRLNRSANNWSASGHWAVYGYKF